MFKKIFFGSLTVVILAVVGATVYLNMIDWNEHKAVIAKQFSEATGKQVAFNGSVSFNIFPTPSLEAADIDIYNIDAAGKQVALAKIQKLVASLSVRSLLQGRVNVENMKVINPEIFIEAYDDGTLNWQSGAGNNQDFSIKNVEVSFGSVLLDNAKVHLIDRLYDVDTLVSNINAEVIAGSLFGPYRIEGSYIKDGNPGGFAIDLGKFSDSFATSVNAVISHPQSESYVRFDGTVLLKNDAVNGNITVESKNPVNFVNSLFKKAEISEDYEHPLAMSLAVKSDKSQIALSNIVIKYAGSAGAGNILIPRTETKIGETGMERRRIDMAFNMAEFNLEPALQLIEDFLKKYDGQDYVPEYNFDIIADLKAVKTTYKNQVIRDLDLSVDFMNNVLSVQNLSAQLPFDGIAKAKGELYAVEKVMTYNFDIEASSPDFAKTVNWLGYKLQPLSKNIYKRSSAKFTLAGTLQTIKMAPFILNVDKTGLNGKLAMVRGKENKYFIIAEADNINFDNYIENMPEDIASADFSDKVNYRFKQLEFLKDKDVQFRLNLNSGIWGKIPFEKLEADGVLKNGVLKLSGLSLGDVASAQIAARGEISGFGDEIQFKNLNYGISVKDNAAFTERMEISLPKIKFNNLLQFTSKGVITGGLKRMAVKSTSKLGDVDAAYKGEISKNEGKYDLNGKIELRNNDFVRMLNNFSINYNPEYPLGLLKFSADIKGNSSALLLKNLNANIGANNFAGELLFIEKEGRNVFKANLNINKFEFERFFYNTNTRAELSAFRPKGEKVPFLSKPLLSKAKIDYDWSKNLDIEAKINAGKITLRDQNLTNASWIMVLNKQVLKIAQFTAEKDKGIVNTDFELNIPAGNKLIGKLNLSNINLNKDEWSGLTYGLLAGQLSADVSFDTSAASVDDLMTQLSGKGTFKIEKPTVKGWNLGVIEADLEKRSLADGFKALVQENLSRGETIFNLINGEFTVDNGNFNLRKTMFDGDTYSVEMTADGNLPSWNVNALCHANFKGLENVSGFDFTYDGGINAPSLETDVSRVTDVYTAHLQKAAAEAKAAADAKIKKYRDLMAEQQERAEKFRKRLNETILPEYKVVSARTSDEKMKRYYSTVSRQINKANSDIGEIISKKNMVDIGDEVIAALKEQNDSVEEQLSKIERDITSIHAQDVRLRINQNFAAISEISNKAQNLPTKLLEANGKFGERLAAISTGYVLERDDEAESMRKKLENLVGEIDMAFQQASRDNVVARGITDIEVLENYATDFAKIRRNISEKSTAAEQTLRTYQINIDAKIKNEEQSYRQRLHDEAVQRKINENTGQITTAGGRTEKVERNLDEIARSEQALRQQGQVLDFSKDTQKGIVVRNQ